MEELKNEIKAIHERNRMVELDKAWETSWTRRIFVASLTYIVALLYMRSIGESLIFLKALIPTGGFLLSTLSLPWVRIKWIELYKNKSIK